MLYIFQFLGFAESDRAKPTDQDAAKLQELNESLTAAQEKCGAAQWLDTVGVANPRFSGH